MVTTHLSVVLLGVAAVVTFALGVYAHRNRREPGATWFALLMASLFVWSTVYAVGLLTTEPGRRLLLQRIMWLGLAPLNVWLFLFALSYTGHGEFVTRRTVALFLVIPVTVATAALTNPLHHLMWREQSVVIVDGLAVMDPTFGPIFWIQVVYSYGMIAITAALLVQLVVRSDFLYTDQSVLLLVGIGAPFLMNVIDIFGWLPQPGVDYTPHAFTLTGLAFGYALFRRQLFDLVPATRQLGRNAAIAQLEDGVVIVDADRRIVYCNAAAADVIGCARDEALGEELDSLVPESRVDFESEDALAELEHDERVYEVRTSPIDDQRGRLVGHTLVLHDVTARTERERKLATQRDELATVRDLNSVLRGVNQGLVSATSREAIYRNVCDRIATADLYQHAVVGDIETWTGESDRWYVADVDVEGEPTPPVIDGQSLDSASAEGEPGGDSTDVRPVDASADGSWTIVPLGYGRTVYGALGLYTDRADVSDREREVLGELGETVGHAINAVETRRLLSAAAIVELELESTDGDDPLSAASTAVSCELSVAGIVPGRDDGDVAYVRVNGPSVEEAGERLQDAAGGAVRTVRDGEGDGLLEWQLPGDTVLDAIADHGGHVTTARAEAGRTRYRAEFAAEADLRAVVGQLERNAPEVRVVSKRERSRPVDRPDGIEDDVLEGLTDRQREAIEAAYRAGYFNWPRDSSAEDVAESLDISAATLHGHLRKAQGSVLADIFESDVDELPSD